MRTKVLIFIDWFTPGYKAGGPIRSCANMVDHLSDEYEFLIVTRNTDYCETIPYADVASNQWNSFGKHSVYYVSDDKLSASFIRGMIKNTKHDVLYINGIFSFYFSILPLIFKNKRKKNIIAPRGMLASGALGVKSFKKSMFLNSSKILGLFGKVLIHATNANEDHQIKTELGNEMNTIVADNLPRKEISASIQHRKKQSGSLKLFSVARIAPEKNYHFALELLRDMPHQGDIVYDIYGPVYSDTYWQKCLEIINEMPENIKVSAKGPIEPEKISALCSEYDFMLMPTLGENFGHIIYESLSSGCPVIISDKTPWRNLLENKAGWDISLEDRTAFKKALERALSMNEKEYSVFSENAIKFALSKIDVESIKQSYRELFKV